MQRRLVSLGLILLSALGSVSLMRAIADNFDPAEKRCAQNMYRLGLAVLLYSTDYDRQFPMAYERLSDTQSWGWNQPVAVPRNWQTGSPHGGWAWANALLPYLSGHRQRLSHLSCPATLPRKLPNADYSQRVRSPVPVSYTYNGYLHTYPLALVDNPDTLPTFWEGLGREHWVGFAPVNPILRCDRADKLCQIHPVPRPEHDLPAGRSAPAPAVRVDPQERGSLHHAGLSLQTRRLGARIAPNRTNPQHRPV
jgi:hypothetical protein